MVSLPFVVSVVRHVGIRRACIGSTIHAARGGHTVLRAERAQMFTVDAPAGFPLKAEAPQGASVRPAGLPVGATCIASCALARVHGISQ